jgi:non-heme chloroperoxidase
LKGSFPIKKEVDLDPIHEFALEDHLMRRLLSLFLLAGALLTAAAFAQTGSSLEIRQRVLTLADQTQIHLLEAGHPASAPAPALVFIPGWTLPASLWNQQIKEFSSDRLVIAVDPRSQGDSSKTQSGNTPEQRAKDLHEILAMLHVSRAVLIGWSQGSQDVAAYIQQFGTSGVSGAVFVDTRFRLDPRRSKKIGTRAYSFSG